MSIAEWKDTRFPWCIDRDFSLFVRNRCVFFHALGAKYLKTLNLAKKLCAPNVICVVYVYGDVANEETLRKRVQEAPGQLMAILVPVEEWVLKAIADGAELRAKMKTAGLTPEMLCENYAKCEAAIAAGEIEQDYSYYQQLSDELYILDRAKLAEEAIAEDQRKVCRTITNFAGDDEHFGEDHDAELLALIRARYPCGVEANAPSEVGARILGRKKLVAAACEGREDAFSEQCCGSLRAYQMSLFGTGNGGAVGFVEDVRDKIAELINDRGYFAVGELIGAFRVPPYGMYDCNYYFYLFALALSEITNADYSVYDGVTSWRFDWRVAPEIWLGAPYGIVKREYAADDAMTRALFEIFDGDYYPEATIEDGLLAMFSWCTGEGGVQEPLAMVDERWGEFIDASSRHYSARGGNGSIPDIIARDVRQKFQWWLCDVPARRADVRRTREAVYALYPDRRDKLDLFYRFYSVKGGAAYMHRKQDFIKRLEKYMASTVCRECGREIESPFKTGVVYEWDDTETGDSYKFAKKDVIGLNKKLLGRQRDEYYCIPCLCEIFDTNPAALWEKIQHFKRQGCTLF